LGFFALRTKPRDPPPAETPASREPTAATRLGRAAGARVAAVDWPRVAALALIGALMVAAVWVRRPGYLLSHPFWLDEAWVADSVRAPLGRLATVTSSTPIGWTLLLRAVPPLGGPERYRLLPLAFGVAATVPAWLLGRQLRLPISGGGRRAEAARWVTPPLAATAAALSPAALLRPGLKQFSAEAFVTVLLVSALAWVERERDGRREAGREGGRAWPPASRRLLGFGLLAALCFPVANAALPVSAVAFAGLALSALVRRAWARLGWVALAAAGSGAAQLATYRVFVGRSDSAAMRSYWAHWFIPGGLGLHGTVAFVAAHGARAARSAWCSPSVGSATSCWSSAAPPTGSATTGQRLRRSSPARCSGRSPFRSAIPTSPT